MDWSWSKLEFSNENLLILFDIHAPITIAISPRPRTPETIRVMKRRDRTLPRFKKSNNSPHSEFYRTISSETNKSHIDRRKYIFSELKL